MPVTLLDALFKVLTFVQCGEEGRSLWIWMDVTQVQCSVLGAIRCTRLKKVGGNVWEVRDA